MGKARKLTAESRPAFAKIVEDTRQGFSEIIDLILIHNERDVRGKQPRTTLNPLIAMLSVAAWERLTADIGNLARSQEPGTITAGEGDSRGFNRIGPNKSGGPSAVVSTLDAASAGLLPGAWRIQLASRGSGKRLTFDYIAEGLDDDLVGLVDWWVLIRHKVAHRALPQLPEEWLEISDAKDGRTINTTLARSTFTMFLQLADQTIRGITEAAEFDDPSELWLPEEWLTGAIRPQRGVTEPDQLQLWFGRSLVTDSTSRSVSD